MPSKLGAAPIAQVIPYTIEASGGLDIVSPPTMARPGTARFAYNYEPSQLGGYERLGGIERYDGHFSPHLADYLVFECEDELTTLAPGMTVEGSESEATGFVIWVEGKKFCVTRVSGNFVEGDGLAVDSISVGVIATTEVEIDGFLDNELAYLAAEVYRADISKVPGFGRIRGLAVVQNVLYAWCNNDETTAMQIHKATSDGWELVPLYWQISFSAGTTEYEEGATLTQGPASATVKRVVVESGDWLTGDAAGRLIITEPAGGSFSGGAAAGGGACTLVGTAEQIELIQDGMVRSVVASFSGAADSQRLYGCDGVNPEFEFADDVLVPLNTGMPIRATTVAVHRGHLFYGFNGSLQHSGINDPYAWTVLSGAAELGAGDTITNLVSVGGSEQSAALMVLCKNSALVLYGDDAENWVLKTLSRVAGASEYSAHDIAGVVALDAPGFVRYSATDAFGNFRWNSVSQQIEPIARGQVAQASVWISERSKYRVFFADGTAVCGMPVAKGQFEWTTIDYERTVTAAVHAEINGVARTFIGDNDGMVYECDVGRSLDGDPIASGIRFNPMHQKSPGVLKQYRRCETEILPQSAFIISVNADFTDENDPIDSTNNSAVPLKGRGLYYDIANWDQSYWDVAEFSRRRLTLEGLGTSIAITIAGESHNQLPHTIKAITLHYTPRRLAR